MTNFCLDELRHTPLDKLSPAQHFVLRLNEDLADIRKEANIVRCSPMRMDYHQSHLRYLLGRLHGLIYGYASLLIWCSNDYDEISAMSTAATNEADFLIGLYLEQVAA